ncbi:histidine phosphatase family protein [Oscillospiraceae bacterium 50-16]
MERQIEMVTFYIVRHGQTLLNQLGRAQGWADSPLTASGKQAAKELGKALSSVAFQAAYTSDTYRAFYTARLVLEENGQPDIPIHQDTRLREWCLGIMEAEQNSIFIKRVSKWLGGISFSEMNKRLPEVATAIKQHDTTGMAETFEQISNRLKELLISVGSVYPDGSNILVVTHAFLMKTAAYLGLAEKST